MFEFHGWVSVNYQTHDTNAALQDACWSLVEEHLRTLDSDLVWTQRYNGCDSLHLAGQHNHRTDYVVELFLWLAEHTPGSYGLLYVRDDEDNSRDGDYSNEFRVWKLCRGTLKELKEPLISPCIPMIENAYDYRRND